MSYTRVNWVDGSPPYMNAANFNVMDAGIASLDSRVSTLETSGGGGSSASGAGPNTIYVAASGATAAQKAAAGATYTCDGTADDVQINAAITAVQSAGGGRVLLSPGTFNLAASVTISGQANENIEQGDVYLEGAGTSNTNLVPASGLTCGVLVNKVIKCHLSDMRVTVGAGATHGFMSVPTDTATGGWRSFWLSSFERLQVVGPWDTTHTGYAFYWQSPFRSTFLNLEAGGTGNGMYMCGTNLNQNPGDCFVARCFMEVTGTNAFAYKIESLVSGVNMNQVEFVMCEGIAQGTGSTGIWMGGAGLVTHIKWHGVNMEQFDTLFNFANCTNCHLDANYVCNRDGFAGASCIVFGTNSVSNWVKNIGTYYTQAATKLINSTATNTGQPNLVEHVTISLGTGGSVTNSIGTAGAVIRKWTVVDDSSTITGVTVAPA